MKKIVAHILIAAFTLGCIPAYADDDHSSSSSGGGGGELLSNVVYES